MSSIANGIIKIKDTPDYILWKLPPGMLDPNVPVTKGQEKNHPRIAYPKEAVGACWADVLQYVLHGSSPSSDITHNKIDKALHTFRNELGRTAHRWPKLSAVLSHCLEGLSDPARGKTSLFNFIQSVNDPVNTIKAVLKPSMDHCIHNGHFVCSADELVEEAFQLLISFSEQNKTQSFSEFLNQRTFLEMVASYKRFLEVIEIPPKDDLILETAQLAMKESSILREAIVLNVIAQKGIAKLYGLTPSRWTPLMGIDSLMEEVRQHRVIGFGAFLGIAYYEGAPKPVATIEGHKIYGWPPAARKALDLARAHFIAVVGVRLETDPKKRAEGKAGHVIYVDPNDRSDPDKPDTQRFYIVSYETFKKHVENEFNLCVREEEIAVFEKQILTRNPELKSVYYGLLPNPPYHSA
jgi:hypothetical protein